MNTTYMLHISGAYSPDVCPITRNESPKLKWLMDELESSFYQDEDLATASVYIENISQLAQAMAYFDGKSVELSLAVVASDGKIVLHSYLSDSKSGFMKILPDEAMTPIQGLKQIQDICKHLQNKIQP